MKKYVNILVFVAMIFTIFLMHLFEVGEVIVDNVADTSVTGTAKLRNIKNAYSDVNVFEQQWISVYGLSQKALGKRTIENFTIYKDCYGKLQSPRKLISRQEVDADIKNIQLLCEYLKGKQIPVYYMTTPLPIADESDLPGGLEDYSHQNADVLLKGLQDAGIPIIDIRSSERLLSIPEEERFYKTDHHWTMETCFAAFQETIEHIEREQGWQLDPDELYTDLNNYDVFVKENCFLGSYGIKVGKYYAGKDDFVVYIPKFYTDLTFEAYDSKHNLLMTEKGKFEDALMTWSYIDNDSHNNKYNSFSNYGYVENCVKNNDAPNDYKVLLISHSYGRPFTQYLSLCFGETRNLDPQVGRYNDDYLSYIESYNPDLVLIMTEFEGELGTRITMGQE